MTDHEAILAYKEGNQEAFSELFSKYKIFVQNCCMKWVKNPEDAEDVSQNVWIHLATYLLNFKELCSFKTIAYRVSKDRSIDFLRLEDPEILLSTEELDRLPLQSGDTPETDIIINDMLKTLDLEERVMIIAKIEGYSDEELSNRLGKPVNSIKSDVFRIREKLREAREGGRCCRECGQTGFHKLSCDTGDHLRRTKANL
jgi:RNA polymerase sigma-70 factor, ECF subfamily